MMELKQPRLAFIYMLLGLLFAAEVQAMDSDGDGIDDIDEGEFGSQTLVNNASLELPVMTSSTFQLINENSVPFWETTATDNLIEFWRSGFGNVPAHDGNQFVELNANQTASLFQDISTPPGSTLVWSVAHRGRYGVESATVSIGVPGETLAVQTTMATGTGAWQVYTGSYVIPAGQSTSRLSFDSLGGGGSGNFIDALTLTVVSRDTDGDGTPDYLDSDSDNDGIPDSVEGNVDTDGDGIADFFDTDSDNDGIPDSVEGNVDTDGDGVPDYRDTDSDGDGVPDANEAAGDSDGDGVDDRLDNDDIDGDGIGNSLDLDDDNDGIPDTAECSIILNNNASFETPVHGSGSPAPVTQFLYASTYNESDVPGWDTTASDDLIELGRPGNIDAHDGTQFAEINANEDAQLFQDFATVPGATVAWSIWHRGRTGTDTARVLIGSPGGTLQEVRRIVTGTTWTRYTGHYKIPAGQTSTRFGFESVATSTGSAESGNFIDLFEVNACADSDGDGIPDSQDIDSDNDGIPDNVEAQSTAGYIAPSGVAASMIDVNLDGLDDRYDASTAEGMASGVTGFGLTSNGIDTDSDGTPDFRDIDSDGDGLNDAAESGIVDQGTGTGDTDGDGLQDRYEGGDANDGFDVNNEIASPATDLLNTIGDTSEVGYRETLMTPTVTSQSTNDSTPVISGTHDSRSTLSVTVDGTTYTEGDGNLVDGGDGTWTLTVPTPIADGTYAVTATSSDAQGSASDTSTDELVIDATAPVPTLAIDTVTMDNILNAMEGGVPLTLTGTVDGDFQSGDTVSLTVDGTSFTGTVDAAGAFAIDVPGSALLADTVVAGSVSSQDSFGNTGTATADRNYVVDTTPPAPTVVIATIATDDVLNAAEASVPVSISGTVTGEFNANDPVTLTVNGNDYTGTVDASGNFSIDVPGAELAADSNVTASIAAVDASGNAGSGTASRSYQVDTDVPAIAIVLEPITGDGRVNAAEAAAEVAVRGTVSGDFIAGDTVIVTIDGQDFTGSVDASGSFVIGVPGATVAADVSVAARVSTTDAAGNAADALTTRAYEVDTAVPAIDITVMAVTPDNVVNAAESEVILPVTGTVSGEFSDGDTVTVTVDGNDYTGQVNAAGEYSVSIPGNVLENATDLQASVSTVDAFGNPGSASAAHNYDVDTSNPVLEIAVSVITADNAINAAEAGVDIAVTGAVQGEFRAGDIVTLMIDGQSYTGPVDAAGDYSITVPGSALAADTTVEASVTTTDAAGNPGGANVVHPYTVDTTSPVVAIAVDVITADNTINAAEAAAPVAVTGRLSGDFIDGDTVTLVIGGASYSGTVDASGAWRIDVPGNELAADTTVQASVTTIDAAGNTSSESVAQVYSVDTSAPAVAISIDPVTDDNALNAAEGGQPVSVTGRVSGDFNAGDTVMLTVNGNTFSGTLDAAGNYAIDVPGSDLAADSNIVANVMSSDVAGNGATASTDRPYAVDTTAPVPTIIIDPVTPDGVVNSVESAATVALSGTVGGDFLAGDSVTVNVAGLDYTTTVDASGSWSVDVDGADLATDSSVTARIDTIDGAGNAGNAVANQPYTVDTVAALPMIALAPVTPDDILNAAEAAVTIAVTGTVSGEFADGDLVTVTVNNKDFTVPVNAAGEFSASIPGSDLAADSTVLASVASTDMAGNPGTASASEQHMIDTASPILEIAVSVVTDDNAINAAEAAVDIPVSGAVRGEFSPGDIVTLLIGGRTYTGPLDTQGFYVIDVPGSELALHDKIDASVTSVDAAGNTGSASAEHTYTVDTNSPQLAIAVDAITADNIVNASEASGPIAVTGKVSGEFTAGDTVTLNVDGTDYTGSVDTSGFFSIDVPGAALSATTAVAASISSTDAAGNTSSANTTHLHAIDVLPPMIAVTVDPVTPDNAVNAAESGSSVTITGQVSGDYAPGDIVTLSVNGATYSGPVNGTGGFAVAVAGDDLAASDTVSASVQSVDGAGNTAEASEVRPYAVDGTPPAIALSLDEVTPDNVLNAAEAAVTIAVTGRATGDFQAGDTVTVSVNGRDYLATLGADGSFSASVPGSDLASDVTIDASVNTADAAGNTASADATQTFSVDVDNPVLEIAVSVVTGDNAINAAEAGVDTMVTGAVRGEYEAGDTVTLVIDGSTYTGVLDTTGRYAIPVPGSALAADGTIEASVTTSDAAGNVSTVDVVHAYTVDTTAPEIQIAIGTITSDNVLNTLEAAGPVAVRGVVSGDFSAGDIVMLTIDGAAYSGPVDAEGRFMIDVPGAALAAVDTVVADVTSRDAAGNMTSATATQVYAIDTDLPVVALTIDPIPDGAAGFGMPYTVTGVVTGEFAEGDVVSVVIDGISYTGPVDANGRFGIVLPGGALDNDTDINLMVDSTDAAGNRVTVTVGTPYVADDDADDDGIPDDVEGDGDSDGDGIPNRLDLDSDNDGLPDSLEAGDDPANPRDSDGDGVADVFDLDSDNDGISDLAETQGVAVDVNNDGRVDDMLDANGDGLDDALALLPVVPGNVDGDLMPDYLDTDTDNDGLLDVVEAGFVDADGDGIVDSMLDSDGDGIVDSVDWDVQGGADADGDGIIDAADIDSFPNGTDSDFDGIIDARDPDADGDGRADLFQDGQQLALPDADGNGIADVAEAAEPGLGAGRIDGIVHTGLQGGGCSIGPRVGTGADPMLILLTMLAALGLLIKRAGLALKFALAASAAAVLAAASANAAESTDALSESEPQAAAASPIAYVPGDIDGDGEADFRRRVYGGFGLGRSWLEPDTSDVPGLDPNDRVQLGAQLTLGFDLNKLISLEAHASNLGDAGLNNGESISYRQGGASALFYAGRSERRIRRVGLFGYGRAGLGYLGNERNGDVVYAKDNSAHVLLGLGLEYAHRTGLALRAETIVFDADVNYTQLGLVYRFDRREKRRPEQIVEAPVEEPLVEAVEVPPLAAALSIPDSDEDGVDNDLDQCPATPQGLAVGSDGCALLRGVIRVVNFHTASADLTDVSVGILTDVAATLRNFTTVRVRVSAHADSVGKDSANLALSQRRADSVATFLAANGVARDRLDVEAFGESRPIADNATAEGRLENRRAELDALRGG